MLTSTTTIIGDCGGGCDDGDGDGDDEDDDDEDDDGDDNDKNDEDSVKFLIPAGSLFFESNNLPSFRMPRLLRRSCEIVYLSVPHRDKKP